jgi:hypothetical protein
VVFFEADFFFWPLRRRLFATGRSVRMLGSEFLAEGLSSWTTLG